KQFASQARMADRILGAEASRCIWQNRQPFQVKKIEDIAAFLVHQPFAADSDGRHFATAGFQAVAHERIAGILAGTGNEPAREAKLADDKRLIGRRPVHRASANQGNDFYRVPLTQALAAMAWSGYDLPVDLDGHAAVIVAQLLQELRNRNDFRDCAGFAVDS